jgi:RNA ligase (TIGR02306 family)
MGILMHPRDAFAVLNPKSPAMVVQSNVDYSGIFGVTKYEPPVPIELAGQVAPIPGGSYSKHDVEQFSVYRDEFVPEDRVVITEKIHGSQAAYTLTSQGDFFVTSKGLFDKHLMIKESDTNAYWRAGNKIDIRERMKAFQREIKSYTGEVETVQVFGEVVPVQGGNWTYGFKEPELIVFDARYSGNSLDFSGEGPSIPAYLMELWVPILHLGKLKDVILEEMCRGNEQISGKELHIKEGIVVRPETMRFTKDGRRLFLKVINPAYAKRETGEEIN